MKAFLFWLLFFNALFANTIVTENDPSTLVNGVSVITGDLYTFEEDFKVNGKEPISLFRTYLSGSGGWNPYPHLVASFIPMSGHFFVKERNGTIVTYRLNEKIKTEYRFESIFSNTFGVVNTSKGKISGQNNLKNQYLIVDPKKKTFVLELMERNDIINV